MMDDFEMIDNALKILVREKDEYIGNSFKRWFVFGTGVILSSVAAYYITETISGLTNAIYNRSGLEEGVMKYFQNRTFEDIAIDELVINAYEFNSQQPRFFSRYFTHTRKGTHDVLLRQAMGGSGAAPIYFDPLVYKDHYGVEEIVIDGGIICNNPQLYAYMMAKYLKGHKNVRVIALGTGRDKAKIEKQRKSQEEFSKFETIISAQFL